MNSFSECKEIIPGLILGSVSDVEQMVEMGADVLVPLAYLDSDVWNTDFRGEILYCPIKDRGVLPFDVLRLLVNRILVRLDNEKKVALFCAGGHGRTGYVAGCVLANKGIKDPIGFLRKEYSPHAVETDAQAEEILTYMEMLKAEMDAIYVPWIDSVSKETNERILLGSFRRLRLFYTPGDESRACELRRNHAICRARRVYGDILETGHQLANNED